MRHGVKTSKLQRNASHRRALLANQACSLILNGRITTTLAKAKALRPYVEKLITLAKRGDVHSRRLATATIHNTTAVKRLFDEIAPLCAERKGGYTRIVKLPPKPRFWNVLLIPPLRPLMRLGRFFIGNKGVMVIISLLLLSCRNVIIQL